MGIFDRLKSDMTKLSKEEMIEAIKKQELEDAKGVTGKEELAKMFEENNKFLLEQIKGKQPEDKTPEQIKYDTLLAELETLKGNKSEGGTADLMKQLIESQKTMQEQLLASDAKAKLDMINFEKNLRIETEFKEVYSKVPEGNKSFIDNLKEQGLNNEQLLKIIEKNNMLTPFNNEYKPTQKTTFEDSKTKNEQIANSDFAKKLGVTVEMLNFADPTNPTGLAASLDRNKGNILVSPKTVMSELHKDLSIDNGGK